MSILPGKPNKFTIFKSRIFGDWVVHWSGVYDMAYPTWQEAFNHTQRKDTPFWYKGWLES